MIFTGGTNHRWWKVRRQNLPFGWWSDDEAMTFDDLLPTLLMNMHETNCANQKMNIVLFRFFGTNTTKLVKS